MLTDLDWLNELISNLPTTKTSPITLFDTLGVSTRETVISNVLAYYLDENEAHGLKRLFLDSLLVCMEKDADQFPSPYTVERERHNIDILIQGKSIRWGIILENKIYHILNNPLCEYWKRVPIKDHLKFGIVVSLGTLIIKEGCRDKYVNITYESWLDWVKNDQAEKQWPDERQRLLYTDFMANMKTLTNSLTNDLSANEAIRLFQEHKVVGKINSLLRKQRELEQYIQTHINAVFAKYGFSERGKRFYYRAETTSERKVDPPFRFFVEDKILTENKLSIYFELHGDATEKGLVIRDSLNPFYNLSGIQFDDNNSVQKSYYHLAHIVTSELMPSDNLPAMLDKIIGQFFISETSIVEHCEKYWWSHCRIVPPGGLDKTSHSH